MADEYQRGLQDGRSDCKHVEAQNREQASEISRWKTELAQAKMNAVILRKAASRAADIIDTNLYRQREKVKDASAILRDALEYFETEEAG